MRKDYYFTIDPANKDPKAIFVWSVQLGPKQGDPEMSCPEPDHVFEYVIIRKGPGSPGGPCEPSEVIVDRTTMVAKAGHEVKQRALYELAQSDVAKDEKRDPARLEVLVRPFC